MQYESAKKRFRARLITISLIGLLAYSIDDWGAENEGLYLFLVRAVLYPVILIAIISDATRGTLKSSPLYKAKFSEAMEQGFVQLVMAIYLMAVFILLVHAIGNDSDIYEFINRPFYQFLFFAPLFVLVYFSMYVLEKNQREE